MRFMDTLYGGCLLNITEIVSLYKVGRYVSCFPYQHTINNFKGNGVYVAFKIGQNCHSLPLVTVSQINSLADFDLRGSELDRYRKSLQSETEQYTILTDIIDELIYRIVKTSDFVRTWDVVLTCIRRHNQKLSKQEDDQESGDYPDSESHF